MEYGHIYRPGPVDSDMSKKRKGSWRGKHSSSQKPLENILLRLDFSLDNRRRIFNIRVLSRSDTVRFAFYAD